MQLFKLKKQVHYSDDDEATMMKPTLKEVLESSKHKEHQKTRKCHPHSRSSSSPSPSVQASSLSSSSSPVSDSSPDRSISTTTKSTKTTKSTSVLLKCKTKTSYQPSGTKSKKSRAVASLFM